MSGMRELYETYENMHSQGLGTHRYNPDNISALSSDITNMLHETVSVIEQRLVYTNNLIKDKPLSSKIEILEYISKLFNKRSEEHKDSELISGSLEYIEHICNNQIKNFKFEEYERTHK